MFKDLDFIESIKEAMESWVLELARTEADKAGMLVKDEAVKDAIEASLEAVDEKFSTLEK